LTKVDIIHRAAIAQDSKLIDDEDLRCDLRPVAIGNLVPRIHQDDGKAALVRSVDDRLDRLVRVRRDGQQCDLLAPARQRSQHDHVGAFDMRAIRRPKIDDDHAPAVVAQAVDLSIEAAQLKVRGEAVEFHDLNYTRHDRIRRMKRWQFWLGLAISLFFVYIAVRGLDLSAFWQTVKTARYWWLIPGVAVYMIAVWARAWRWHYLLRPVKQIPTNKMFPIVCIGYMGNNIYPARAGEVLRAVILKRKEGVSVSASLATVIVERIFDGVVMLAFVFLNLPELARINSASGFVGDIQSLTVWGAVIFAVALAVFLLAAMFPHATMRVGLWFIYHLTPRRLHEKIIGVMNKFLDGLASLRSPLNVLMVFLTSAVIWLLETGKYWFVMHAFDFHVSFFALMLMNGIVNLATTIPSAPGYVGTFDTPGIAVLQAYGVDKATATGYTLVLHIALWIVPTVLGAYFLAREGIHWSDQMRQELGENVNEG